MDRWGIPVAGLLLFCGLCAYCVQTEPREIEEDLTARSIAALRAGGIEIPAKGLRFDGQTAILTGAPGSAIVSEDARARVEAVWGVSDVLLVSSGAMPAAATVATPSPVETTPAAPPAAVPSPVAASAPAPSDNAAAKVEAELQSFLKGKSIGFVPNRNVLTLDSRQVLKDVAKIIKASPATIPISISGHTDSDGDAAKNVDLSNRRAATVKRFLASNGVANARLSSNGFGASKPIAPNDTPEGKAQNRRIEIHAGPAAASSPK